MTFLVGLVNLSFIKAKRQIKSYFGSKAVFALVQILEQLHLTFTGCGKSKLKKITHHWLWRSSACELFAEVSWGVNGVPAIGFLQWRHIFSSRAPPHRPAAPGRAIGSTAGASKPADPRPALPAGAPLQHIQCGFGRAQLHGTGNSLSWGAVAGIAIGCIVFFIVGI